MSTSVPILRTSERSDFKRCPWLWHKSWVEGLTARRSPTWALFGTAIHAALEVRYPVGIRRGSLADTLDRFEEAWGSEVRKVYSAGQELEDDEVVDALTLGKAMLTGYVEHYGDDIEWEVIHTEQSFQIDVPMPNTKGEEVLVRYAGTWDLLARNRNSKEFYLWDHKTRRSFPSNWSFYSINDQAGSYLWVGPEVLRHLGVFGKNDRIEGLVFNALRKHLPDKRPRNAEGKALNKDGSVSKLQPAPLFHREEVWRDPRERVQQARRVQAEALVMHKMRTGELPLFKTPTEDCTRCKFFELCELDEKSPREDVIDFQNAFYIKRDPYADHREEMTVHVGVAG